MGRGTRTIAAAMTVGALLVGCGDDGPTEQERAQDALGAFVEAVDRKDGAAICASLTPNAVRSVEKLARAQRRPQAECADLVRGQLAGFRPPEEELEVTADREVAEGRRELVAPTLNGLTTAPFTLVREETGGEFRVALFAGDDLGDRLKRSAACSRLRQTALRLPFPPSGLKGYPAYLRRVAAQVERRDRDLRAGFGSRVEAEVLQGVARSLRRAARDMARGREAGRAKLRADGRLLQIDALVTYVARTGGDGRHDCGPDPHLSDRAKVFRKRVGVRCRRTVRAFRRLGREIDGASSAAALGAALTEGRSVLRRLNSSVAAGPLPDRLDVVRDATVRDLRRLDRIIGRELAAIRRLDLPALQASIRELEATSFAGDVGIARLKLRSCADDAPSRQATLGAEAQRA